MGATGSHADLIGFSPYLEFKEMSPIADGPDAIRKAVRSRVKYGADLIKMMASAGVLSEEGSVGAPQYSQEEMDAVVAEARMWGRDVAAHAHGSEAIRRAVVAGVRSIEHGSMLDDQVIALMKERGTWLVADIYNDDFILAEFTRKGYPEALIAKERSVGRVQRESFRRAARAGVRIAFGTDAGIFPHGCERQAVREDGRVGPHAARGDPVRHQRGGRAAPLAGSGRRARGRPVRGRDRRRG